MPGWNNTSTKAAVLEFLANVTDADSELYVPPERRIAVFDNDGTLWAEEPWPVPIEFVFWRIRKLAANYPEWKERQPYKAVLDQDSTWLEANSRMAFKELSAAAQAGITTERYEELALEFLSGARHPSTGLPLSEMVYVPMLELIRVLQARQFQVYVVSGGDLDFIRAYAPSVYGIARSNVIGSYPAYSLEFNGTAMDVVRGAQRGSVNVGGFKVVNIHLHIGRRPILAMGNSDGDLQMLRYVAGGDEPYLVAILDHDDSQREFAVASGAERLLLEAEQRGWLQISMKRDFGSVFLGDED